ncbi:MAG: UDP-N-acetylglucosamine 2-epimerase (non-hydrolyzing) [Proteobacteria bacterium]|nr:UDP-N-acetylglucosamine 2-epimerase (non-hydrolyzing) [Pseudomonadota bacterium]MBU1714464.1 UDP-N-acetylglucosamine 2-epimerase (non-hydrolyzing) [Pseudomonadota bacterium]
MKKVLIVFGTRPEAIKMAPVIKELEKYPTEIELKVCVTAQHREMLDQILQVFAISPDYDLNIMQSNQDIYDITINVLAKMKGVLAEAKPDLVLVHGDTTTTFAASLAAFYQQIAVGHVEGGLRTHNIYSPFPEEMNRQLASRLARFHFAPTAANRDNLLKEGIPAERIIITGNTVIDALLMMLAKIQNNPTLQAAIDQTMTQSGYDLPAVTADQKILLVTGHRRENFGQGFLNICEALKEIAHRFPDLDIVYPVHLNPNVREPVNRILSQIKNIFLIEPLPYEAFLHLMGRSTVILTDSGGIQEESPSLSIPTVVMRDNTERQEAVDAGTVKLVGTDKNKIIKAVSALLNDAVSYQQMAMAQNPYGDGKAAKRIADFIRNLP